MAGEQVVESLMDIICVSLKQVINISAQCFRDTYSAFIRKYSLQSASMVQNSVRFLLEKQILTYRQDKGVKIYSVADRFLRLWLVKMY